MLPRRPVAPFLMGAGCMLLLVIAVMWAVPRWIPAGGLVIRIGPNARAADRPNEVEPVAAGSRPAPPPPNAPAARVQPAAPAGFSDTAQRIALIPSPTGRDATPGQLLVPVRGVTAGQLVDTYTQSRGQGRVHDAID